jgi:hypothetical protein
MHSLNRSLDTAKRSDFPGRKHGASKPSKRNNKGRACGMRLEPLEVRRMLSIAVTSTHDGATDPGLITLIGAMLEADSINGGATIVLPADSTFTLSQGGYLAPLTGNGAVTTGITLLPGINQPITIDGNGSTITLASGAAGRFFSINSSLTLDKVNLIGGVEQGGAGGGGFTGGGGGAGLGGAIFVNGLIATLTMNQASIGYSSATGGAGAYYDIVNSGLPGDEGGGGGGGLGGQGADHSGSGDGIDGGGGGGSLDYTATTYSTTGADGVGGTGGTGSGVSGNLGGVGGGGGGGAGGTYVNSNYLIAGSGGTGGFGGGGGGGGYSTPGRLANGGAGGFGGGGGASGYGVSGGGGGAFAGAGGDGADNLQIGGGGAGLGGAIFNYEGVVNLNNVSLVGNSATGGSGFSGGSGAGGAIFNDSGTLTLQNATLADSTATAASGSTYAGGSNGSALGGGIYNYKAPGPDAVTLSLYNSVVAGNQVVTQGSSGANAPVEGDVFDAAGGTVTANGTNHNFIGTSSGTISGATVLTGTAYLDFPGLFGGYLMAPPEPGSPLAGAGDPSTSLTVDETGATRSVTTPTIGAYEGALPSPFPLSGGTVVVTDSSLGGLFAIDPTTGNRETLSAANVLGTGPALITPTAVALDGNGNAYVVTTDAVGDSPNEIFKINLTTGNRTLLSGGSTGTGTAFQSITDITYDSATSSLLVTDSTAQAIYAVSTTTGNRTLLSNNSTPNGTNAFAYPTSIAYNSTAGIVEGDQSFDVSGDSALLQIANSNGTRTVFSDDNTPSSANPIGNVQGIASASGGTILLLDSYSNPTGAPNPTVLDSVSSTGARTLVATLASVDGSSNALSEDGVAAGSGGTYVTQTGTLAADNQVLLVAHGTATELAGNDLAAGPFFGNGLNIGIAIVADAAPAAPSVTTNPANATMNSGGNTTFTAAATGSPAPTEQWQISTDGGATFGNISNGGIYSGATSATLTISGGTTALNADRYRVVFTNTQGSATSTAATLTVDFAPTITTNPINQTVSASGNTTFTAAATGLPAPTVQWQTNYGGGTFFNINNSGAYSGVTTNTLTITGATSGMNNYQYRAVYSNTLNGAGSSSTANTTAATLTVNYAPILGASPSNATINAGGNASFTSSASGNPIPTQQWQVSTDGGATFTNITDGGVYSGSATGTLSITAGTLAMNGYQYRDVFTNGSGTVTSSPSTLAVIVPAAAQFSVGSETINQSTGTFSIPVSISGTTQPVVSTFASGLVNPEGMAFDSAGNMYVANYSNNTVSKVTPAGVVSTFATGFSGPDGVAFDAAGNLYVSNGTAGTVSKVTPGGTVSLFASGFSLPNGLAFDAAGNLYVANTSSSNGTVSKVTPGGTVSTFASGFANAMALAFDATGNLYVSDHGTNTVSRVTSAGVVTTFASGFSSPDALTFDPAGNLYVANPSGTVSVVTPAGLVSTFASGFNSPFGLAYGGGKLYVANYFNNTVSAVSPIMVTVPFTLSGTAASGTDFSGVTSSPLTFAPGQTTQNITGTLLSDPGPSKTLTLTLGAPTGASLGSPAVNTLTIQNTITLNVTNMTDSQVGGELSLREALAIVSGSNGNYIINVPAGTIDLTQGILSTDDPGYSVTINGVGPGPTVVDAQGASAVMQVTSGTTADITNFDFTGGYDTNNNGYGGGGIQNAGTLTLNSCTIDSNTDTDGGEGGGIGNLGTLTINDSAITGNSTDGDGGAIYNDGGTLTVINSTIANNSAGIDDGGGITSVDGTCSITDSTVDGNSGGGVFNIDGTAILQGSIVADSTGGGPDVYGQFNGSYDLIGDGSGIDSGSGLAYLVSGEPMLSPLGNYGGPTQTMAPLPGSPAIASGSTFSDAAGLDQRGIERSLETPTIGAFESQGFDVTTTNGSGTQSELAGTPFSDLQIHVTSNDPGVPVTGGIVTFTAPQSGASAILGTDTATLDGHGDAEISASANTTAGSYSVIASAGSAPSTNGVFSLTNTAPMAPTVTTNPANDTINSGGTAVFTAAATGNPTPTAQWQVSTDGGATYTNITSGGVYSGATSDTLTITGATAALNGNKYQDVFTNTPGTATTTAATLTVDFAATVATNPINQTVNAGGNTTFSATANGFPVPTVRWQVSINGGSGFFNLNNGGIYGGVTTGTLTLTGATLAQNGYEYRAVFSNTLFGADDPSTARTTAATLTVDSAPVVGVSPMNATINAGGNATFTSSATGNPTPTQQWQVSTDGGATFTNITDAGVYSGSTTGTLTITAGTADMNGYEYQDVFTNGNGSATTDPSTLTVDFAPSVTLNPANTAINMGSDASFTVAAAGNPTPTVQWQVSTDGGNTFTNITDSANYTGTATNTLTVTGVTLAETGYEYQAVFSNTLFGADGPSNVTTTAATLTVDIAPVVSINPTSATINAGGNASFTSSATGTPTPTQQWQVSTDGGETFTNITDGGVYSGSTTGTLSISGGTADMTGCEYQDVFTNGAGIVSTSPSTLTVNSAPPTIVNPLMQMTSSGKSVNLKILGSDSTTETDAGMTYLWSLISAPVGSKPPVFADNGTHTAKRTTVAFSKAGNYRLQCVATDTQGLSVSTTQLITITQIAKSLKLSPHVMVLQRGTQQQYSGMVLDQFGHALRLQPTLSFSVKSGVGSITIAGLFNAGSQAGHSIIEADTADLSGVLGATIV